MLQSSGIGKRWQLGNTTEELGERSSATSAILFAKKQKSNRYKFHCVKILEAVPYDVSLESIGCSLMKNIYNGQGQSRHWKSGYWDQYKANATFLAPNLEM